ncbi:ArnT family glycosyltransferase [Solimonas terrae]|uniref:Glycosyltransferase family 39 protein n=1 Tax=Solimonas terrae TaxID=1396819 RepID=A0A6M2BR57_9GAMM|nr:glycosyltransferase family 39 protein [Solimonas terrae]NGY04691.1 glycosyltransferase family 39 protein [Solimonas terrae]
MSGPGTRPMSERGWLLLFAVLGFVLGARSVPLFDLDEGAFSEATIEMLDSGNYVSTTLNGEPRYDKPMLTYWLQAAAVRALGRSELAFRLPSILCATLWMWLVHAFARARERTPGEALVAAAALSLGLMSSVIGHAATADGLLNLLLASAGLDIFRWYEQPRRSTLLRVYLAIGLGLLAKGPVALAIPGAVSLLFFATQGRLRLWWRAVLDPLGWLLLTIVVAPWVYASIRQDGGIFLGHFLLDQNVGRYSRTMEHHGGHWWFYLAALPLIVLPFTGVLRAAFGRALVGGDALDRYCLIWFALVLLLFSLSATQLPHYLLYGCTPLFLMIGRHHQAVRWRRLALLPGVLLLLALAALPWLLPVVALHTHRAYEHGIVELAMAQFHALYFVAAAAALALSLAAMLIAPRRWPLALLLLAGTQAAMLWGFAAPAFAGAYQVPTRDAALRARALGLPTVMFHTYLPSFSVYRGAPTPQGTPQPGELVFVRADRLDELQHALPAAELSTEFKMGGIVLLLRRS